MVYFKENPYNKDVYATNDESYIRASDQTQNDPTQQPSHSQNNIPLSTSGTSGNSWSDYYSNPWIIGLIIVLIFLIISFFTSKKENSTD